MAECDSDGDGDGDGECDGDGSVDIDINCMNFTTTEIPMMRIDASCLQVTSHPF